MLLLVGDDWAEDHHDVELQDETGRRLGKARLPEGITGIARLHAMIGEYVGDDDDEPAQVVVGIETERGFPPLGLDPAQKGSWRQMTKGADG